MFVKMTPARDPKQLSSTFRIDNPYMLRRTYILHFDDSYTLGTPPPSDLTTLTCYAAPTFCMLTTVTHLGHLHLQI